MILKSRYIPSDKYLYPSSLIIPMKSKTIILASIIGILFLGILGTAQASQWQCDVNNVQIMKDVKPVQKSMFWKHYMGVDYANSKAWERFRARISANEKPYDSDVIILLKNKVIHIEKEICIDAKPVRRNNFQPARQEDSQNNPIPAPTPIPCIPTKCENGYKGQKCCNDPRDI